MKNYFLAFCLLLLCLPLWASHVSGGEFNVTCLGNNNYQITYTSYTICGRNSTTTSISYFNYDNSQTTGLSGFTQQGQDIQLPNTSPCAANPNGPCTIQRRFTRTINLPPNNNGYLIYQSSNARSSNILNIQNSSSSWFAYYVRIPGGNNVACNNTPVFDALPPASICTGLPISLDLSATDSDGDSLVYSWADPLATITTNGTVAMNPIRYNNGTSRTNQTGSNLSLNTSTGIVNGVQLTPGLYSIAVQVDEYRNGVHIGTSMRDFIYNFQTCPSTPIPVFDANRNSLGLSGSISSCTPPLVLDANQNGLTLQNFVWSDGTLGPIINVTQSNVGTLTVGATNASGCLYRGQVNTSFTPMTCSISGTANMCANNVSPLIATCSDPSATITWTGNGTSNGWQFIPSGSGWVYCNATDAAGICTAVDSFQVTLDQPVSIDLGPDTVLCNNEVLSFNVDTLTANFVWENGSTSPTRDITTSGNYSITVTSGICTAQDQISVTKSLIAVGISGDSLMCSNNLTALSANCTDPTATNIWNASALGATFTPSQTGWVRLLSSNGFCVVNDSFFVKVDNPPAVDLGNDTILCNRASFTLNMDTLTDGFIWGDQSRDLTRTFDSTGIYTIEVTRGVCVSRDSISILNIDITAEITGDTSICEGETTTLTANVTGPNGTTFEWQDQSLSPTYSTGNNEQVTLTVTNGLCSVSDITTVVINPLPNFTLGPDTLLCNGASLNLSVPIGNFVVLWDDQSRLNTRTVNLPGTYYVTLTSPDSCSLTDSINISVNTPFDIIPKDTAHMCRDSSWSIDLTGQGQRFNWIELGLNTPRVTITETGLFHLSMVDNWGCPQEDQIYCQVDTLSFDLGADTVLCSPYNYVKDLSNFGSNFIWSDGNNSGVFTPNKTGVYVVNFTNLADCPEKDQISIHFDTLLVSISADTSICDYESVQVLSTVASTYSTDNTYSWTPGNESTPSLLVNDAGNYQLTVTDGACSASDEMTLTVHSSPIVNLGNDTIICANASLPLSYSCSPACQYLWSSGSTAAADTISSTGWVWLNVTNNNACLGTDSLFMQVEELPVITLPDTIEFCQDSLYVLRPTANSNYSYYWSTGATTSQIEPTLGGVFWVRAASEHNCFSFDSSFARVYSNPVVDLGEDFIICDEQLTAIGRAPQRGETYLWNTGFSTDSIRVTQEGRYILEVFNELGCVNSDDIVLTALQTPTSATELRLMPCDFKQELLQTSGPHSTQYEWNTEEWGEQIAVKDTGTYYVTKTNYCGWGLDTFTLAYQEECDCRVFVPSAFSPDGDGSNDSFLPLSVCDVSNYELTIFNRWGGVVFQSNNSQASWDGHNYSPDVYVYLLEYKTWQHNAWVQKREKGTVTLLR